jgi:multidrug resistance efflux pump
MKQNIKKVLWTGLSAVLLCGMGYSIFNLVTRDSPTTPRPPDVVVAKRVIVAPAGSPTEAPDLRDPVVSSGAVKGGKLGGNGIVEPRGEEVAVAGQVAGRIAEVFVREGAKVEAGAPLLRLDDTLERAAVEVAKADLEVAKARLDKVVAGSRAEDVRRAAAQVREAQARAALSRGVLTRLEELAKNDAATVDELDRARRAAEADRYAASAAEANRAAVVAGNRAEDIAEARASVAVAEARLMEAEARLGQRVVTAPMAGEVLQVKVRAGAWYQPGGEAPFVMGETSKLYVRVDIDERDFAKVRVGAKAEVMAKAFGQKVFAGRVVELGRKMGRKNVRTDDPTELNDTKILEVLVELDGFEGLVVGQRVVALIEAAQAAEASAP